ncbi:MAG TPA: tetratricopeptide repeat protein, partial [Flavobacteriaceae bacterium]|nr:tetratricopeptide repeat protein [Flavobacteriaceae bacterium]
QYQAAQMRFKSLKETTDNQTIEADCAYYIAYSAVRLQQPNADRLMEDFATNYPTSLKRNGAYLNVANYYFDSGNYGQARKWYDKVEERSLQGSELNRYNFNSAYSYFKEERYNEAKKHFSRVVNTKEYGSQATYYLGFIAYEGEDYAEAKELFQVVESESEYAKEVSYYQADMSFKSGEFQKALDFGLEQFPAANRRDKSELAKIIGESYFNLEQYDEAIPYLKEYLGKNGRWNNTDYYQLGYAYYKQGKYQDAINEFNRIIDGKDAIAQNAFYHLAESYLHLDQKQQALNAFKNASEMNFSAEIKEDAWLNYAKLSYEIGNSYQSVPSVLLSFIEEYPNNNNNAMLQDLLIDSYVSSKNYEEALKLLETNKKFENKLAYQKVAFLRGVEVFEQNQYNEAITYFDKSLREPRDAAITARATFWKAEADYQLEKYADALIGFKQFAQLPGAKNTPEYANRNYNLGYTEYQLDHYTQAITYFTDFTKQSGAPKNMLSDAYLRLGDSYFVTSKYWPAMENYNEAIDRGVQAMAYAEFQKSISYGFVDRTPQKVEGLLEFITKYSGSSLRADAMYELGNTYVNLDENNRALAMYDKLLNEAPRSRFVPMTLLKKALLLDNSNRTDEALNVFKKVASDYPSTPEALQAVESAKMIYIDRGQVDNYATWAKTLDFVEVKDAELDHATFQTAEKPYLESNHSLAEQRLNEYIKRFPKGIHTLKANFYLGQLHYAADEKDKALPYYENVAEVSNNEFTEPALARISEIYLSREDYKSAIVYLEKLAVNASHEENKIFAKTNSMKAYYELKDYNKAVAAATEVLAMPTITDRVKSDAILIEARSAMETGNEQKAKEAYQRVAGIATGKLAAEALYYDAYFKNKEGAYKTSNEQVQKLARDYSGYKEFGARGLVLMAKNFYALEDAYQATYILTSIEENFQEFPQVVAESKALLQQIKDKEAKTNASVNKDGNEED